MGPSTKAPLQHIISEVNETTSALTQLEGTIRSDKEDAQKQGRLAAYKPEGMAEVERLATQCLWVFRLILGLLERASQSKSRSTKLEGNPQALNTQLDPESLKLVSFFLRGLDDDSIDWLKPRLLRCHKQLHWLRSGFLVHLQLAGIAEIHLNHGSKQSGAFELEFGFRAVAERLRI